MERREKGKRLGAVTVGTFDGVHRGHRAVLACLREEAGMRGLEPLAVTFDRHPLVTVAPDRAPKMITGAGERDSMIAGCGVSVRRVEFTEDVRRMTAAEWMRELRDRYGARLIVLGYDNRFGCDGATMTDEDLRRAGRSLGLDVMMAPVVEGCSSSAVRRSVAEGDMEAAAGMLGRPFSLSGTGVPGRQLGRTIGVPTANLAFDPGMLLPRAGVYAASVMTPGGMREAVVNVGSCPTVTDGDSVTVEAHLLDYSGDLYGQTISIFFHGRLRDERKFGSLDQLTRQIGLDIEETRRKNLLQHRRD